MLVTLHSPCGGIDGRKRSYLLSKYRKPILGSAIFATLGLSIPVIGWLIWLPAVFTGCAAWVAGWEIEDHFLSNEPQDPTPATLNALDDSQ